MKSRGLHMLRIEFNGISEWVESLDYEPDLHKHWVYQDRPSKCPMDQDGIFFIIDDEHIVEEQIFPRYGEVRGPKI